jgi:hypothetical protein
VVPEPGPQPLWHSPADRVIAAAAVGLPLMVALITVVAGRSCNLNIGSSLSLLAGGLIAGTVSTFALALIVVGPTAGATRYPASAAIALVIGLATAFGPGIVLAVILWGVALMRARTRRSWMVAAAVALAIVAMVVVTVVGLSGACSGDFGD